MTPDELVEVDWLIEVSFLRLVELILDVLMSTSWYRSCRDHFGNISVVLSVYSFCSLTWSYNFRLLGQTLRRSRSCRSRCRDEITSHRRLTYCVVSRVLTTPSSIFPMESSLLAPEFSSSFFFLDFWLFLSHVQFGVHWMLSFPKGVPNWSVHVSVQVCYDFFRGYVVLLIRFVVQLVSTSFDRCSVLILHLLLGTMFLFLCISLIMILSISYAKMITMM